MLLPYLPGKCQEINISHQKQLNYSSCVGRRNRPASGHPWGKRDEQHGLAVPALRLLPQVPQLRYCTPSTRDFYECYTDSGYPFPPAWRIVLSWNLVSSSVDISVPMWKSLLTCTCGDKWVGRVFAARPWQSSALSWLPLSGLEEEISVIATSGNNSAFVGSKYNSLK